MTLVLWAVPEEFYYDHTDKSDNDPDYSLPAKWTRPAINVKHEILQALYSGLSGERAYVLQLAESFERLIQDRGIHVKSVTSTAYQRFLVYCCSVYYKLAFGVDYYTLEIFIVRTPTSQMWGYTSFLDCMLLTSGSDSPPLRIADMVPIPPELSVANLRLANLQLRSPKPTTQIPTLTAQKIDPDKHEITIAEREAEHEAAVARIFVDNEPDKPSNNESDTHPATDSTVRILRRSETTPSQSGSSPQGEEHGMDSNTNLQKQPPAKRPIMTLAERDAAYREARDRIFRHFEGTPTKDETNNDGSSDSHSSEEADGVLDLEEWDPAFSRAAPATKSAIRSPSNTDRPPNQTVRFQDQIQLLPQWTGKKKRNLELPISWTNGNSAPISISSGSISYEEDLENSETASMSGAGSVYSHASSRTKSTDYGLYYTRRAFSQESLSEIVSGTIWRPLQYK